MTFMLGRSMQFVLEKVTSGDGASTPFPALDITHLDKETRMPFGYHVGDSIPVFNTRISRGAS